MYINKDQLESRLKGQNDLNVNRDRTRKRVGTNHLFDEQKVLIGVLSQVDTQANVAKEMGVSPATVSNIARGLDASKRLDQDLIDKVAQATPSKETISNKALNVLMNSLGVVDDKMSKVRGAAEASVVAKNMAIIADKMIPRHDAPNNSPRILININGPRTKEEKDYEVVEVPAL